MQGITARLMGMPRMDPGPVSDAQRLFFAGVDLLLLASMWIVMMVGMMLPSAAPTILLFAAVERKRQTNPQTLPRTGLFVLGYFLAWSGFSVLAAALQTLLARAGLVSMWMVSTSALFGGALFVAAGLYELTPFKDRCLAHCRSPLEWLTRHHRPGASGALRMGIEHGLYCIGCCAVLMLLLFVGGVMNLLWVALIAAMVLVQKLAPGRKPLFTRLGAGLLIVAGIAIMTQALASS